MPSRQGPQHGSRFGGTDFGNFLKRYGRADQSPRTLPGRVSWSKGLGGDFSSDTFLLPSPLGQERAIPRGSWEPMLLRGFPSEQGGL